MYCIIVNWFITRFVFLVF